MNKLKPLRHGVAASLLLPWALAGLPAAASAGEGPLIDRCNENQGLQDLSLDSASGGFHPELTGIPLQPGQTVPTDGTNKIESPELVGKTVIRTSSNFSFNTLEGPVAGLYEESIQASASGGPDRGTCKQHTKLKLTSGCIAKVRFNGYHHENLPIVADFRDDLPGKIRSDFASRSDDGLIFEFHLKKPVCAGQTTRWLLLNTSIFNLTKANALELVAPDGTSSPLLPVHVPLAIP